MWGFPISISEEVQEDDDTFPLVDSISGPRQDSYSVIRPNTPHSNLYEEKKEIHQGVRYRNTENEMFTEQVHNGHGNIIVSSFAGGRYKHASVVPSKCQVDGCPNKNKYGEGIRECPICRSAYLCESCIIRNTLGDYNCSYCMNHIVCPVCREQEQAIVPGNSIIGSCPECNNRVQYDLPNGRVPYSVLDWDFKNNTYDLYGPDGNFIESGTGEPAYESNVEPNEEYDYDDPLNYVEPQNTLFLTDPDNENNNDETFN